MPLGCPAPGPTQPRGRRDRQRGCRGHRTDDEGRRWPIGAAWSEFPVPGARPHRGRATVRRCSPASSWPSNSDTANSLGPFAMWPAFPSSDYYGPSAPPPGHQQTACLPAAGLAGRQGGGPGGGSHVHHQPVDGGGAQLFPCSLATATPQAFTVASWRQLPCPTRSRPPWLPGERALLSGPHPPGSSRRISS